MIDWLKGIFGYVILAYNEALEEVKENDKKRKESNDHTSTFNSNNYGGFDGE